MGCMFYSCCALVEYTAHEQTYTCSFITGHSQRMLQHSSSTFSKVSTSLFHHSKLYLDTQPKFLATFLAKNIPPYTDCFSQATEQSLCCQNYVRLWTGCLLTQLYHCSTGYVSKRSMLNFTWSKCEGREKRSVIYIVMPLVL